MRDYSQEILEESRPNVSPAEAVDFCLRQLYRDRRHETEDEVVARLTFEELIGALLLAKDEIEIAMDYRQREEQEEWDLQQEWGRLRARRERLQEWEARLRQEQEEWEEWRDQQREEQGQEDDELETLLAQLDEPVCP